MKIKNKVIGIMLFVLIVSIIFGVYWYENMRCHIGARENCDISCEVSSDCTPRNSCNRCINEGETCSMSDWGTVTSITPVELLDCQCIKNKCEPVYVEK
jgi:hypothetical protein